MSTLSEISEFGGVRRNSGKTLPNSPFAARTSENSHAIVRNQVQYDQVMPPPTIERMGRSVNAMGMFGRAIAGEVVELLPTLWGAERTAAVKFGGSEALNEVCPSGYVMCERRTRVDLDAHARARVEKKR